MHMYIRSIMKNRELEKNTDKMVCGSFIALKHLNYFVSFNLHSFLLDGNFYICPTKTFCVPTNIFPR